MTSTQFDSEEKIINTIGLVAIVVAIVSIGLVFATYEQRPNSFVSGELLDVQVSSWLFFDVKTTFSFVGGVNVTLGGLHSDLSVFIGDSVVLEYRDEGFVSMNLLETKNVTASITTSVPDSWGLYWENSSGLFATEGNSNMTQFNDNSSVFPFTFSLTIGPYQDPSVGAFVPIVLMFGVPFGLVLGFLFSWWFVTTPFEKFVVEERKKK